MITLRAVLPLVKSLFDHTEFFLQVYTKTFELVVSKPEVSSCMLENLTLSLESG